MVKKADYKIGLIWITNGPIRVFSGVKYRLFAVTKDKAEARRACANYRGTRQHDLYGEKNKEEPMYKGVFKHRARLTKVKGGWGIWIDSL